MDFASLKAQLVREKRLWEDPDFPCDRRSLTKDQRQSYYVRWLRPWDIIDRRWSKPMFVVKDATRFDLHQGEIGDCWFVAAMACLAVSHEKLFNRCIPRDQDFEQEYAGIFRFYFWQFGRWTEVVVDDRLPTLNGQLVYARNDSQPHEFWVPLVEKAYAKLKGNYDSIGVGGHTCNALVDFTGGISESIDLRKQRSASGHLFDVMYAMMAKSSMLACDIESKVVAEYPNSNGLYKGHAYSITNLIRLSSRGQTLQLLRLRNPWGKKEWSGKWSDGSPEWNSIPARTKQEIGMEATEDGEFWMSFEDFVENFEFIWICHLEPDAITQEVAQAKHQTLWDVTKYEAEWIRGFNAGGCGNPPYRDLFWRNPQFSVTLSAPQDEGSSSQQEDTNLHMVVSLMQHSLRHDENISMSVMVYKVREGAPELLDGENYDRRALSLASSPPTFINLREVSVHHELPPGNYVVIPCTFTPNQESRFLLRVYTEMGLKSQELDIPTTIKPERPADDYSDTFNKFTNGEKDMDARELSEALNDVFRRDVVSGTISVDTARNLLAYANKNRSGVISFDEFRMIVEEVTAWKEKFQLFDKDRSGDVDTYEMADLFNAAGIRLSRHVTEAMVRRYGGKNRRLTFEDFVHCCCRIIVMYGQFVKFSNAGPSGKVEFALEEWLAETV